MLNQFSRTRLLLGPDAMAALDRAHVAVFGVGGVGGFAVEALARSGVGELTIVDDDLVCLTNANRQVIAGLSTVGQPKVEVMARRIADINPLARVHARRCFYLPETAAEFDFAEFDYVIDAVDTVTAKLTLVEAARAAGVPLISCMGAANKLDPTQFRVADIYETRVDPLARVMRKECRARGIESLRVVYSPEPPLTPTDDPQSSCAAHCICPAEAQRHCTDRRAIPGSVAFVPPVAGLIAAGEVVRTLAG